MESTRQQKIERLIQKDLSDILLKYARVKYARAMRGTLISVSEVRISPDLSIAHVYLSVFPQDKVASTIAQVQEDTAKIRGEMGHMQRHQLRIIPELHFHLDETIDKMARIDELLKQ